MDSIIAEKYRVIKEIGSGGMGVVYKAKHISLGRYDAIKVLHSNLSLDVTFTQSFLHEAQSMARLNHENIIRIYDTFEYEPYNCISMEYFEGLSLSQVIKDNKTLSLAEIIAIVTQCASGLAYAHAQNIIHRDIKPSNIMLNSQGLVKITDFGITAAAGDTSLIMTGELVGSPRYMSPEQALNKHTDNRSDLYSLGMVFYELLTRASPFDGDSGIAILGKLAYEKTELPLVFPEDTPEIISHIIRTMLSRNPNNRYPSALSLQEHLTQAANNLGYEKSSSEQVCIVPDEAIVAFNKLHSRERKPRNTITQAMIIVSVVLVGVLLFVSKERIIPPLMALIAKNESKAIEKNSPNTDEVNLYIEDQYHKLEGHKVKATNAQSKLRGLHLDGLAKTTYDGAMKSLLSGTTEYTKAGEQLAKNNHEKASKCVIISEAFFEEAEKQFLLSHELVAKNSSRASVEGLIDEALFLQQEMFVKKESANKVHADQRNILEYSRGIFYQKEADDLFSESKAFLEHNDLISSHDVLQKSIVDYGKAGDYFVNAKLISRKLVINERVEQKLAILRKLQLEVSSAKINAEHDGAITAASIVYNKANSLYQELQHQENKIHNLVDNGRDNRAIGQLTIAIELATNTKLTYIKASRHSKSKKLP
ncbi:MAG: serine/threonine protein kinase [Thiohalomonadales bacterium]